MADATNFTFGPSHIDLKMLQVAFKSPIGGISDLTGPNVSGYTSTRKNAFNDAISKFNRCY